jgi:hypothetical protein
MQSNSFHADTDVTRTARGYRARLRTDSPTRSGERVLEHASCEMLADAVAVVIALAMAEPRRDPRQGEALELRLGAAAFVATSFGMLPKPALGFGAAAAVELHPVRLELRGAAYLPEVATFASSSLGGRFSSMTLAARACWLSRLGAFELGPCIGIDMQRVSAAGVGGDIMVGSQQTAWGPAFGAFGRVRLAKTFGVLIVADGAVPVTRLRFVYPDVGAPLHRTTLVVAQLLIAPEVQF